MNAPVTLKRAHTKLFKNHGNGEIGTWEIWVEGNGDVVREYARKEGTKVTRQVYTAKPKSIGRANETTPLMQAQLEVESLVKKQLDKGYVANREMATITATNTLGFPPPMLATPLEKVKPEKIDFTDAFVQPKLDGHRALFCDGVLYSRQGKEIVLPHITRAIEEFGLDHLHLDGELYLHGYTLQEISSLIKRDQEGTLELEYHVYDIVEEASFGERYNRLVQHFVTVPLHRKIRMVDTESVPDMERVMAHHAGYRRANYEGTMLRFGDEEYRTGKRSRSLLKIKEFLDDEFEIVGVEEGKPYIRENATYRVPVWVLRTESGSTFTATAQGDMSEKHALWETREQHIGKLLTVKYHYLSKDGVPQLPVALRFREDV